MKQITYDIYMNIINTGSNRQRNLAFTIMDRVGNKKMDETAARKALTAILKGDHGV